MPEIRDIQKITLGNMKEFARGNRAFLDKLSELHAKAIFAKRDLWVCLYDNGIYKWKYVHNKLQDWVEWDLYTFMTDPNLWEDITEYGTLPPSEGSP